MNEKEIERISDAILHHEELERNKRNKTIQTNHIKKMPSRNDVCPCGATWSDGTPKKYKDCCGRGKV